MRAVVPFPFWVGKIPAVKSSEGCSGFQFLFSAPNFQFRKVRFAGGCLLLKGQISPVLGSFLPESPVFLSETVLI